MGRRQPFYLLIDVSDPENMDRLDAIRYVVQKIVQGWQRNPYTLDAFYLSVITFGSQAEQIVPLIELGQFYMPPLTAGGRSGLGEALKLLVQCAGREVRSNSSMFRGDLPPNVLVIMQGNATDDVESALHEFRKRDWGRILIYTDGRANEGDLSDISRDIVPLKALFYNVLSESIQAPDTNTVQKPEKMPFYVLIDVSAYSFLSGNETLKRKIKTFFDVLKEEHSLQNCYISIIAFAEFCSQLFPLTEISSEKGLPQAVLKTGQHPDWKNAFAQTLQIVENETSEHCWMRPLLFIFSDCHSDSDFTPDIRFNKMFKMPVIIALSDQCNMKNAEKISSVVLTAGQDDAALYHELWEKVRSQNCS